MKNKLNVLSKCALFKDIDIIHYESLLLCLNSKHKHYKKDDTIIFTGDIISSIGIIISGNVQISKENVDGDKTIITELSNGDVFAETFVCAGMKESPVNVVATNDTDIIIIDFKRMITSCNKACGFHAKLIENMLRLVANKNLFLSQKNEILSCRSMRQKLMIYFCYQMKNNGSSDFDIIFSRQELADYLCVDRSSMSRELCKMRDEGVIKFKKSKFSILK